mgnify:FL=1|tara:strand:+ start:600 stop:1619 length:1020 start_codon:yes stop_codon:yes gene_type:complete
MGAVLGQEMELTDCRLEPIGTGQVGANYRAHLNWKNDGGPSTVVIKFAALDPQSRATGIQVGTYQREAEFYRHVAPTIEVSVPQLYYVDFVEGTADIVIVMEDLDPREQGDQLRGCSPTEAALALTEAAKLHRAFWSDETLFDLAWVSRRNPEQTAQTIALLEGLQPAFVERYRDDLTHEATEISEHLVRNAANWFSDIPKPSTLVHGDFRLDNLMFAPPDKEITPPVVVVDWQTVAHSHGAHDVSYFVGSAFEPDIRRQHEEQLVSHYFDELTRDESIPPVSWDELWLNYRRFSWSGFIMAVLASMIVGRTDRGDEMFVAMANRHASQVVDLGATEFL